MTNSNGTGRGGRRTGAGRKPAGESTSHLYEPCVAALTKAMDGATPLQFIFATIVLRGSPDDAREALGLTREAFAEKYGEAITSWSARHAGTAVTNEIRA